MKSMLVSMAVFLFWSTSALVGGTHFILGVDGMSCPFCAYSIEKQLKQIDGVEDVKALDNDYVARTGFRWNF